MEAARAHVRGPAADEGAEDGVVSGVDVVLAGNLQETQFDKDGYKVYIKEYMKKVKVRGKGSGRTGACSSDSRVTHAHARAVASQGYLTEKHPDREKAFTEGMPALVKKILGNFKNYQFFTGSSMDTEGLVMLMDYREAGITPYFIVFRDGLEEMKV